jgi:uncharacterized membrane protein
MQPDHRPADRPRPLGHVSTFRLETFSDGVFAVAVTLLALRLHPPNLAGATTAGAVADALAQQLRQYGFDALAFLVTGGLWSAHHRLLDPLETHGHRLPRANLWFLLSVSLLPYWVNVLAAYPNNNAAAGLLLLWLAVVQVAFRQLCLVVRSELTAGSVEELIMPRVIRATIAAVLLAVLGGLLVAQVEVPDAVVFGWLLLLVVGGRGTPGYPPGRDHGGWCMRSRPAERTSASGHTDSRHRPDGGGAPARQLAAKPQSTRRQGVRQGLHGSPPAVALLDRCRAGGGLVHLSAVSPGHRRPDQYPRAGATPVSGGGSRRPGRHGC